MKKGKSSISLHRRGIIHHFSIFVRSRDSSDEEARAALSACLKELGIESLQFVSPLCGNLDYCLQEFFTVCVSDWVSFHDVSEDNEDVLVAALKCLHLIVKMSSPSPVPQTANVRTFLLFIAHGSIHAGSPLVQSYLKLLECSLPKDLTLVENAEEDEPEQQDEENENSDSSGTSSESDDDALGLEQALEDDYDQNLLGQVSNGRVGIWVDTTKHETPLIIGDLKLVGGVSKPEIDTYASLSKEMHRQWVRYTGGLARPDITQVAQSFPGYQVLCLQVDNEEDTWRLISPLSLEFSEFINLLTMIKLRPPEYYFLALTVTYNEYQGPTEGVTPIFLREPEMDDLLIMEIETSAIVSCADFIVELRRCYETYSGVIVREAPTWANLWPGSRLRYLDRDQHDLLFCLQWPQVQVRLASIRVCVEEYPFPDVV